MSLTTHAIAVWAIAVLLPFGAGCEKRSAIDSQPLIPAAKLTRTDILPSSTESIDPRRNYVYCATFELAWDELRDQLGKKPIQLKGDPRMARILNDHPFERSNVSPDDYLVMAGRTDQGIVAKIREAMANRFPRATLDVRDPPPDAAFYVYSYLAKNLLFAEEFDVAKRPLRFHTSDGVVAVTAFEAKFKSDMRKKALRDEITILDYREFGDFIIRLNTTLKSDELILAQVPPAKTLEATIEAVRLRIKNSAAKSTPEDGEFLKVPMISIAVERNYDELTDRVFLDPNLPELYISQARQDIRFCLDERGARLESSTSLATSEKSQVKRLFIFDHPFLLYMQKAGASAPYFAVWIANDELLKKQ